MKARKMYSVLAVLVSLVLLVAACAVEPATTGTTKKPTSATTSGPETTASETTGESGETTEPAGEPHETLENPNVSFIYWVSREDIETNLQGENYFDRFESAIPVF